MPGPKPNPDFAFRDLYRALRKLRAIAATTKQQEIVNFLFAVARRIEPLFSADRKHIESLLSKTANSGE